MSHYCRWNLFRRMDHAEQKLERLVAHMASTDDQVRAINAGLDELVLDLADLRDEVADSDATAAAKFDPIIARITELGGDVHEPPVEPA